MESVFKLDYPLGRCYKSMSIEEIDYLIVYPGHNTALLLYKRLLKRSCDVELVSTPIKISYGCSQAVKFRYIYIDIINEEIQKIKIRPRGVYKIDRSGRFDKYEKV